jgi:hypothetical protein
MASIGVPVHVSRDERAAMKIAEIVARARVLDAEKISALARVRSEAEAEEFERVYAAVLSRVKATDTTVVTARCFVHHLSAGAIRDKLRARFASDGLPTPVVIHVDNDDRGDGCMCFWTSLLGCCLPLGYWAAHCVHRHFKGDAHTIRIQF